MKFFTELEIKPIDQLYSINYSSNIVSLGSCFAQNIALKMDYFKFRINSNPFGVLFHCFSIENIVKRAVVEEFFSVDELVFYNGLWHSFQVHSQCDELCANTMVNSLNSKLLEFKNHIKKASHFIVTLGTAWGYEHRESGEFVANCHKIPQTEFDKKLASVQEIKQSLYRIKAILEQVNPDMQYIFTISPVRHLKDGFIENQQSKSTLIIALHQFLKENTNNCYYFPAYELMMDQLRDYRFYQEDLLHPSSMALDFIWDKFVQVFINNSAQQIMKEVQSIQKSLSHRAFQPQSLSHQDFIKKIEEKKYLLQQKIPWITF